MPVTSPAVLPKNLRRSSNQIDISQLVAEATRLDATTLLRKLGTQEAGLSQEEAGRRLTTYGPNVVTEEAKHTRLKLFATACRNPLVILLLALATLSFLTGDVRAGIVMLIMVVLGVVLRFVQEARADDAAAKLKAMISVTATVIRDSREYEIPLAELVPGDLVKLSAGDMIPADLRLLTSKDLFVIQSSLTGESLPVEKFDAPRRDRQRLGRGNEERLLFGNQRGKRQCHGPGAGNRLQNLPRQTGEIDRGSAGSDQLRQRHCEIHMADDSVHPRHGPRGVLDKRSDETQLD